jgi:hypothetical protein
MTDASEVLRRLHGRWEGSGHGEFPTIESFDYRERADFILDEARQLVRYTFDDVLVDESGQDVRPTHAEVGILRVTEDNEFELLSAQTGRIEVLHGVISSADRADPEVRFESVVVAHDPRVLRSARILRVAPDRLHYETWMELATLEGVRIHTRATLRRAD